MRLAPVGLVTEHLRLIPVQQLVHLADVGGGRIGGGQAVHDAALVTPDMRLHAKVPLPVLKGLMHLGVSRLLLVLRRGRRCDDRRIHDRSGLEQQSLLLQERADLGKDLLGQLMPLKQVAEPQDRRLVRNTVIQKLDARKAPGCRPIQSGTLVACCASRCAVEFRQQRLAKGR